MDYNMITYLACICFIFIFGRIFIVPIKKILKLVLNSIIGGVTIYIINLIGGAFGFHIGLNFFTSIIIRTIRITRSNMLNNSKTSNLLIIANVPTGTVLLGRNLPKRTVPVGRFLPKRSVPIGRFQLFYCYWFG